MQNILMPIDFSDATEPAVDYVAELARQLGAEVDVLHVSEADQDDPKMGKAVVMPQVEAVVSQFEAKGCQAYPVLVFGPPAASILDQIDTRDPTMVVMGSHGHSAFYDLVMGSVTHSVLRSGKCPLLIVPSPRPAWGPTAEDLNAGATDDFYGFPGM